jgi:hypothetical protein
MSVSIMSPGLRLELAGLNLLHSPLGTTRISMAGSRGRFELARLRSQDGLASNPRVGRRSRGLALELARLNRPIVSEIANLGLGLLVALVRVKIATGYLGSAQSLLGKKGISNLSVLLLGGAGGAPDLTRVLLEGLQVELNTAAIALKAKFVVGIFARFEGLEGISILAALCTGFGFVTN